MVHTQHCGYWCPGANADHNTCYIGPVLDKTNISVVNNIKNQIKFKKMIQLFKG